jgi:hypothetical protein
MQDIAAVLAAEYPQGVDVVYEGVGGALRAAIMQHLAPNARVLQVGDMTASCTLCITVIGLLNIPSTSWCSLTTCIWHVAVTVPSLRLSARLWPAVPTPCVLLVLLQVGYIAEYPHTGQAVSSAEGGFSMDQLFWGGKSVELDQGKKVYGQIWPKVGTWPMRSY